MSKIIPLTTEMAIRQHTRKVLLENLRSRLRQKIILESAEDKMSDAEVEEMIERSKQVIDAMGAESLALSAYLNFFRGENQELLGDLSSFTTFPVSSKKLYDLYSVMYGIISADDPDLKFTRSIAAIYGDMNETMGEFALNMINPADPLNWIGWLLAIPTGGASLGLSALLKKIALGGGKTALAKNIGRNIGSETAETGGEAILKRTARGGIPDAGDDVAAKAGKDFAGELDTLARSKKKVKTPGSSGFFSRKQLVSVLSKSEKRAITKFLRTFKPNDLIRGVSRADMFDELMPLIKQQLGKGVDDIITDPDDILRALRELPVEELEGPLKRLMIAQGMTEVTAKKLAKSLISMDQFGASYKKYLASMIATDAADSLVQNGLKTVAKNRVGGKIMKALEIALDPVGTFLRADVIGRPFSIFATRPEELGRLRRVLGALGVADPGVLNQSGLLRTMISANRADAFGRNALERVVRSVPYGEAGDVARLLKQGTSLEDVTQAFRNVNLDKLKSANLEDIFKIDGNKIQIDKEALKDLGLKGDNFDFGDLSAIGGTRGGGDQLSDNILYLDLNVAKDVLGPYKGAEVFRTLSDSAKSLKGMLKSQQKYAGQAYKDVDALLDAAAIPIAKNVDREVARSVIISAAFMKSGRETLRNLGDTVLQDKSDAPEVAKQQLQAEERLKALAKREYDEQNAAGEFSGAVIVLSAGLDDEGNPIDAGGDIDTEFDDQLGVQKFSQKDYEELKRKGDAAQDAYYDTGFGFDPREWSLMGVLNGYDAMLKTFNNWGKEETRFVKYFTTDWNEEMADDIDLINFVDAFGLRTARETPKGYSLTTTASERDAMVNQLADGLRKAARGLKKSAVLDILENRTGIAQTGGEYNWKKFLRQAKKNPLVTRFENQIPEFRKAYQIVEAAVSGQLKESMQSRTGNRILEGGNFQITESDIREIIRKNLKKKRINEVAGAAGVTKKAVNEKIFKNLKALTNDVIENQSDLISSIESVLGYPIKSDGTDEEKLKYYMALTPDLVSAGKIGKAWLPAQGIYKAKGKDYLEVILQGPSFGGQDKKSKKLSPGPQVHFKSKFYQNKKGTGLHLFASVYSLPAEDYAKGGWSINDLNEETTEGVKISNKISTGWYGQNPGKSELQYLTHTWGYSDVSENPLGIKGKGVVRIMNDVGPKGVPNFRIKPEKYLQFGAPPDTDFGSVPMWRDAFWLTDDSRRSLDDPEKATGDAGDVWLDSLFKDSILEIFKKRIGSQSASKINPEKLNDLVSKTANSVNPTDDKVYFVMTGLTLSAPAGFADIKNVGTKDKLISNIKNAAPFSDMNDLVAKLSIKPFALETMNDNNKWRFGHGGGAHRIREIEAGQPVGVTLLGYSENDKLSDANVAAIKKLVNNKVIDGIDNIPDPEGDEGIEPAGGGGAEASEEGEETSAAAKRDKERAWVQSQSTQGLPVVDDIVHSSAAGNAFTYERGLAFYAYQFKAVEEEIEKNAPDFYKGMYTPAYGKGNKINLQLGDTPADQMRAAQRAVIRHAWKNNRGVFGNKKYRSSIEAKPELMTAINTGALRWSAEGPTTQGLGNLLGTIPGLEAYDPSNDNMTLYSAALFFMDLANNRKEPSQPPRGGKKRRKTTDPDSTQKPTTKKTTRNFARKNPRKSTSGGTAVGSSESKSRITVLGKRDSKILNIFKGGITAFESAMTKYAPYTQSNDTNNRGYLTIKFKSNGKHVVKASNGVGSVLGTNMRPKIKEWEKSIQGWLRSDENCYHTVAAEVGKTKITIINSSLMNRPIKEGTKRQRKNIKVSRVFTQKKNELERVVRSYVLNEFQTARQASTDSAVSRIAGIRSEKSVDDVSSWEEQPEAPDGDSVKGGAVFNTKYDKALKALEDAGTDTSVIKNGKDFVFPVKGPCYNAGYDVATMGRKGKKGIAPARKSIKSGRTELVHSKYGIQNNDWTAKHKGIDIFCLDGQSPLVACVTGVVTKISKNSGRGGNTITITRGDPANAENFYYAHLNSHAEGFNSKADIGKMVTAGTVIGSCGRTGSAIDTYPHLHFSYYVGGSYNSANTDPWKYLEPALRADGAKRVGNSRKIKSYAVITDDEANKSVRACSPKKK